MHGLEYGVIWERDRQPTITVQADVSSGAQGIDVTDAIDKKLDALRASLPGGLPHRGRRAGGGKRQGPGVDQRADAGDG